MLIVLAAGLAVVQAAHGHAPASAGLLEVAHRPIPLRTGIGSAHDEVGTRSADAQSFYDQGLAYLHSYVWIEAARSFNQALRLDPKLAIAYAGLSIAYVELNASAAADEALAQAMTLAPQASAHDRRHIEARARQAAAERAPGDTGRLAAYRSALDAALAADPADEEFWLARGRAESPDPAERGQGSVAGSVRYYDRAGALGSAHFAAHHYLTHAYENSGRVEQALVEAAAYAKMAPNVPHARHMRGHDLRRVGRIEEAIAEFSAADALSRQYFEAERVPAAYDWHFQHNLDLLGTAYQYTGRMAHAEERLKESFAIASPLVAQEVNKRAWPMFLRSRGRTKEALDAAAVMAAHRSPVVSAAGHVEIGEARLAAGEFQAAADEANAALRLIGGAEGGGLVATALQALQGEFFLRTGRRDTAHRTLEEAVRKLRAAPGPDAWTGALFALEEIARAARDADDWAFADWTARQMLAHDPSYGGTHYALGLAAEHNGDAKTARAEYDLAKRFWKHADPDLAELKRLSQREKGE